MRRRIAHGLAVLLLVASLGAGAAQKPNSSEAGDTQSKQKSSYPKSAQIEHGRHGKAYQVGTASWYGEECDGNTTASGEPFDMYDFTAAHPTLPLGTYVRVTNLHNGRAVVVRVNDRGPVIDGRIIDVSYNAARALDFKSKGVQRVRLDLVSSESTEARLQPVAYLP
jgi:peptidoglycan lytic transglycosylase